MGAVRPALKDQYQTNKADSTALINRMKENATNQQTERHKMEMKLVRKRQSKLLELYKQLNALQDVASGKSTLEDMIMSQSKTKLYIIYKKV